MRHLTAALILVLLATATAQLVERSQFRRSTSGFVARMVGETLPDVSLRRSDLGGPPEKTVSTRLSDAVGSKCAIALFFSPTCFACEAIAPLWSGRSTVLLDGQRATVLWIAVTNDVQESGAFMSRHGLNGPLYTLPRISDVFDLGVHGTPTLYFIDPDPRLEGVSDGNPETLPTPRNPGACIEE